MRAPLAAAAVATGPEQWLAFFNARFQAYAAGRAQLGQTLAQCFQVVEQGFTALVGNVYRPGQPVVHKDLPLNVLDPVNHRQEAAHYHITLEPLRDADGQVEGVLIFGLDTTTQVRARAAATQSLADQQAFYEMLLREAPAGIVAFDAERRQLHRLFQEASVGISILSGPDLVYELVNPGYQALFPGHALLGRPLLDAMPELSTQQAYRTLSHVLATGDTTEELGIHVPVARPADGQLEDRYFNYSQQARRNETGQVDGVLVFVFEVTEQVQAREVAQAIAADLQHANEQLMRTNIDLDNVIYTASHDLKAPISNIEGLLYLLQDELPPPWPRTRK